MSIHLFGIRHHGPGCARSLRLALEALKPDSCWSRGRPTRRRSCRCCATRRWRRRSRC